MSAPPQQLSRGTRQLAGVEVLHFDELCGLLDPEDFETSARRLVRRLDRHGIRVETTFPRRRLVPGGRARNNLLAWYRAEVQRIPVMDRAEEQRFCMGLELLWRRLKKARRAAGLPPAEVERWPGSGPGAGAPGCAEEDIATCLECPRGTSETCVHHRLHLRLEEFLAVRNELVERNLHIVFRLLERYRNAGVPVEDMVQEANYSLFKAVENFDFTRGVRFKTYATYWVNQAFLNAIYNQSRTVRVPAYIQKAMKKIRDTAATVGTRLDDVDAISRESGVPVELVATAMSGNRFTISLDQTVTGGEEDGGRMLDLLEAGGEPELPRDAGEEERLRRHLAAALETLSPREVTVLRLRYGLDGRGARTLAAVGQQLSISLERVRQIQKGALEKIRQGERGVFLEQYA